MVSRVRLTLGVCLLGLGCASGSIDDPVVHIPEDDPELRAAEEKARDNLDDFLAALANPSRNQSGFSIKVRFEDGDASEFMWLTDLTYAGGSFTGALNNEPQTVRNIKLGDRRAVDRAEVTDWLYLDGEEMRGGYTIQIVFDRMRQVNPAE